MIKNNLEFGLVVSTAMAVYLASAAGVLAGNAVSPADRAVVDLLWVLTGAAALVAFALGLRLLAERGSRHARDHGSVD